MGDYQWYELIDSDQVISPSLLVYPERIRENTELMLRIAGDPTRLRPHIKTHKMLEIIKLQRELGIDKFKCASLAEAELLAKAGAKDVLLAMQPVSVHLENFCALIQKYSATSFSTLIDHKESVENFSEIARNKNLVLSVWLDINNGMNRTGISPGKKAVNLFKSIEKDPCLDLKGLHVYDGHIHDADLRERTSSCDRDFQAVIDMANELSTDGLQIGSIVAGGTPTFPIHQKRKQVELSPGTPLLWDQGYAKNYADLQFVPAAVLLTRIISKPGKNLLCFDLGHKSVASEMTFPRVAFLGNHDFEQVSQSEEHLVVKCSNNEQYGLGETFYAVPVHICPTVSKYPWALTVEDNRVTGSWRVAARDHILDENLT